jgi:DNA helicase HerA-like ATPase
VGAIQRGLLTLEQQGAEHFFGEPMLDIKDWMRTDSSGKGIIILSSEKLYQMPKALRRQPAVDALSSTNSCPKRAISKAKAGVLL